MIIIIKSGATDAQINHVLERVEQAGLKAHLSRGTHRTIIGVIGDEIAVAAQPLSGDPGRGRRDQYHAAIQAGQPGRASGAERRRNRRRQIGGGHLGMIAGPCAIESAERMDAIAKSVRASGANILRGGAFKPRTSPYAYQGMGEDGLKILREAGDKYGMPVVTEVMDPRQVELVDKYADMIQIGARNMQNFTLLTEVGSTNKPVLLKRGMSATIVDLLMSAEYILSQGNPNVVLCERGIKSFDTATRNLFDVAAVPLCKGLSHLPIIVDPSHATGRPDLIPPCALAGVAAGADGVHIEVHNCPEEAMSDGPQALLPEQYEKIAGQIRELAKLLGKNVSRKPKESRHEEAAGSRQLEDESGSSRRGGAGTAVAKRAGEYPRVDLVVFPPSVYLDAVRSAIASTALGLGAQNMCSEPNGAFTGEISAAMLVDLGCRYVILGHSERRHILGETDEQVNKKTLAALAAGLVPIVCVGELLAEREAGQTGAVIRRQFEGSLGDLSAEQIVASRDCLRARLGHRHGQSGHARAGRGGPYGPSQDPGGSLQCDDCPDRADSVRRQRQGQQCGRVAVASERRRGAGRRGQPEGRRVFGHRGGCGHQVRPPATE